MPDDPTNPYEGYGEPAPLLELLQRGSRLFEQLKQVDGASAARQAVYGEALSVGDLQAIVLQQIVHFRQQADSPDDYAAWWGR